MKNSEELKNSPSAEVPNIMVVDAASQFMAGFKLLEANLEQENGLLLPMLNLGAMALELYLKAFSCDNTQISSLEVVEVNVNRASGWHGLVDLLGQVPPQHLQKMKAKYAVYEQDLMLSYKPAGYFNLESSLHEMEGLFMVSRYSYELGNDIGLYDLELLVRLCRFFQGYITNVCS